MSEEGPKIEPERTPGSHYELFCVQGASWYLIDGKFGVNYGGYDRERSHNKIAFIANNTLGIIRENAIDTNPKKQREPKISNLVLSVRKLDAINVDGQYRVVFIKEGTVNQSAHIGIDTPTPAKIEVFSSTGEITEILQAQMDSQG